jgi:hypothetical protein
MAQAIRFHTSHWKQTVYDSYIVMTSGTRLGSPSRGGPARQPDPATATPRGRGLRGNLGGQRVQAARVGTAEMHRGRIQPSCCPSGLLGAAHEPGNRVGKRHAALLQFVLECLGGLRCARCLDGGDIRIREVVQGEHLPVAPLEARLGRRHC